MQIVLLYLTVLLLPGAISIWLARCSTHRFFYALLISISVFVLTQIPFRIGGGQLESWLILYTVTLFILFVLSAWRGLSFSKNLSLTENSLLGCVPGPIHISLITLLTTWSIVFYFIGPYTEVPSDFWGHLVRVQWELGAISSGRLSSYASTPIAVTLLNREYIHTLHALVWWALDVRPTQLAFGGQLVTTSIFIASIFLFSITQFPSQWSSTKKSILGFIAAALTVLALGTGNWAFIRYYAFAPVMLNLPLFFFGVILFIEFLKNSNFSLSQFLGLYSLLLICLSLIHIQEAIFLGIIVTLLASIAYSQLLLGRFDIWPANNFNRVKTLSVITITAVAVVAGLSLTLLPLQQSHPGVLFDLGQLSSYLTNVFILNPNRQLFSTIALSGLAAYAIATLNWRTITNSPYLIATLLLPFLTVFNPLFIEIWQRLLPTTLLWRFALLIPSGLVIAYVIGTYQINLKFKNIWVILISIIAVLCFIPINTEKIGVISSRLPSFIKLDQSQNIYWLDDVANFLNSQPRRIVRTDPVSSYVLRGMTNQRLPGRKFYPHTSGFDFNKYTFEEIKNWHENGYILVNLRDGAPSKSVISLNHWKKDELQTSRYYPKNFISVLNDAGFEIIWSQDYVYILK